MSNIAPRLYPAWFRPLKPWPPRLLVALDKVRELDPEAADAIEVALTANTLATLLYATADVVENDLGVTSFAQHLRHGQRVDVFNAAFAVSPRQADPLLEPLDSTSPYTSVTPWQRFQALRARLRVGM